MASNKPQATNNKQQAATNNNQQATSHNQKPPETTCHQQNRNPMESHGIAALTAAGQAARFGQTAFHGTIAPRSVEKGLRFGTSFHDSPSMKWLELFEA